MNLYLASNLDSCGQFIIAIQDGGLAEARSTLAHAGIDTEKTPLTFLGSLDWMSVNVLVGKFVPIDVTKSITRG